MRSTAGWTPEKRALASAKASAALRARPVNDATRNKIAEAQRGPSGHNWRGDSVGYQGAHKRHRSVLPKACQACGQTKGRLDVALRKDVPVERLLGDLKRKAHYSVHTEDYERLCRACHVRRDNPNPNFTPAARAKRAELGRGKRLSQAHREKISAGVRRARNR